MIIENYFSKHLIDKRSKFYFMKLMNGPMEKFVNGLIKLGLEIVLKNLEKIEYKEIVY